MTAQIRDALKYNGETYFLASEPLREYLYQEGIEFSGFTTACWRGYVATWEIKADKLFMVSMRGNIKEGKKVDLSYLFPDQSEVFAEWFTGEIKIPHGELLEYVHMGYGSVYEKEMYLSFEKGVLCERKELDNRKKYENEKQQKVDTGIGNQSSKKSFLQKLFRLWS